MKQSFNGPCHYFEEFILQQPIELNLIVWFAIIERKHVPHVYLHKNSHEKYVQFQSLYTCPYLNIFPGKLNIWLNRIVIICVGIFVNW